MQQIIVAGVPGTRERMGWLCAWQIAVQAAYFSSPDFQGEVSVAEGWVCRVCLRFVSPQTPGL